MTREVVITGLGLVSSAGEGAEAHLAVLHGEAPPRVATASFAPYPVHPIVALDFDRQIAKRADQRQMETWQRLGCYAAGLALEAAGLKDDAALKARMHLIVAAGVGERDHQADEVILSGLRTAEDPDRYLNERLTSDLRPTLFLAQLSNLLAGNIAIVHGVTGASRTFMGEEASGVDVLRVGRARIASGQNDILLVGGAYNAERPDGFLVHALGGFLWTKPFRPVWERPAEGGGFIPGSGAAFLVLESREHAERRGARSLAALTGVAVDRTRRQPGEVAASLERMWREAPIGEGAVVLSGATGVKGPTEEEQEALARLAPGSRLYAVGDILGHMVEPQAPAGVALAAALIDRGEAGEAVVTSIGHWRGEGLIALARAT